MVYLYMLWQTLSDPSGYLIECLMGYPLLLALTFFMIFFAPLFIRKRNRNGGR